MANGVFDIFHIGHLLYLEAASRMGDRLVVAITRNAFVNKGPSRPMFDEGQRQAIVGAVRCVDQTLLCNDSLDALAEVKPDIFVKGSDYIGKIEKRHADYCAAHGIEIRFTDQPIFSATKIIHDRFRQG
jgi:cytidyltransferase-like protein